MDNFVKNKKQFFAYLAKQIIKENDNIIIPYRSGLGETIKECYMSSLDFYKTLKYCKDNNDITASLSKKKKVADKLFKNHNIVWPF